MALIAMIGPNHGWYSPNGPLTAPFYYAAASTIHHSPLTKTNLYEANNLIKTLQGRT